MYLGPQVLLFFLCLDKCEQIIWLLVKTRIWIFLSFLFKKSSTCSLLGLAAAHNKGWKDVFHVIPIKASTMHQYSEMVLNINNVVNVEILKARWRPAGYEQEVERVHSYMRRHPTMSRGEHLQN